MARIAAAHVKQNMRFMMKVAFSRMLRLLSPAKPDMVRGKGTPGN